MSTFEKQGRAWSGLRVTARVRIRVRIRIRGRGRGRGRGRVRVRVRQLATSRKRAHLVEVP